MGFLEDTLERALPQGSSLAKPLMLAFVGLLASGALSRKQAPSAPPASAPSPPVGASQPDAGGLLGGLGGLLETLNQAGHSAVTKSWVGTEPNQSIPPNSLGSALGPTLIKTLAEKTGTSEQEVTAQLSQLLPQLVDKLTPDGRLPTRDEMAQFGG